jgi:hypothetical protein
MIPLFVLPFILFVVLASSTSGDQHFYKIVTLFRPPSMRIGDERERLVTGFARDDKEPGPSLGGKYPESGFVKPPKRDKQGAASLSGAEENTARAVAHAQCACLLSLQVGSIN